MNNENDNVAAQVNFVDHGPLVVASISNSTQDSINQQVCLGIVALCLYKSDTTEPVENNKERPDLS